ncbi:MAG: hypothetical protein A3A44_01585 [Candidatus Sungbacteria bacterium RIFCSPLOWO2_01_FULL_60_25]|uniref:LTD domain-containing protein n=1 Tax=Candidatus Sungbacteria bacterium RIFCSPLOWO2_01_FULL_60_25 TaxID=1802281 RepID=A0A1G2LGG4_9BACT|nr:MAG: hypothetical protein A3A44_01585 [Candidatus Sungbacteria bacterium RIFCSPLOWO2_01_FULL_60_25]
MRLTMKSRLRADARISPAMRVSGLKLLVAFLIVGMNWVGLAAVGTTLAYYNDNEGSSENALSAGSLDFSLDPDEWTPVGKEDALLPGDTVSRAVSIFDNGTIGFQYTASLTKTAGDDAFCNALELEARQDGVARYIGPLMDFLAGPFVFAAPENWLFNVTLPAGVPDVAGMSCEFKFVFNGWQEGFAAPSGFHDEEEVENILEAAFSATANASPIADAYVHQAGPDSRHGTETEFDIKSASGGLNKRAFARFGFHFPDGTSILSSSLRLFMKASPSASRTYAVARALSDWVEDGITWNNQPATSSPPTASASSGTTNNVWLSWDVTADVDSFVDKTFENFGWEVHDTAENSAIVREAAFIARENSDETKRPVLEITFAAPAATTTHLVVNEVYADVGSPGKGSDGTNEWVELYNPTGAAVDIKNWQICDSGSCDTLATTSPSILIPSHGFAIITPNVSTWPKWEISGGTVEIVLGSNIGGGLANEGDAVILKDISAVEVDAMSYGDDASKLNPAVPVSGDGNSLARIVKGYDTDSAQDWIINATPNPGTNPSDDGIETMRFTASGVEVAASGDGLPPLALSAVSMGEPDNDIAPEEATSTEPIPDDAAAAEPPLSSVPATLDAVPDAERDISPSTSTPGTPEHMATGTPSVSATAADPILTPAEHNQNSDATTTGATDSNESVAASDPETGEMTGETAEQAAATSDASLAGAQPVEPEATAAPENEPAITPDPVIVPEAPSPVEPAPAPEPPSDSPVVSEEGGSTTVEPDAPVELAASAPEPTSIPEPSPEPSSNNNE